MAVAIVNKVLDALGFANDNEQEIDNEDIYELEDEKEEEADEAHAVISPYSSSVITFQ